MQLRPVNFDALPSWRTDNLSETWEAFVQSCQKIAQLPIDTRLVHCSVADWATIGQKAGKISRPDNEEVRRFFETYFLPHLVISDSSTAGTFTGYFVPQLRGSRTQTDTYNTPLYKRPNDLIMIEDLGIFREPLRGKRIAGKLVDGNLHPYLTRSEIEDGGLADKNLELVWVDDPVDAFFMAIQGSGYIEFEDGTQTLLGYAGTNGHDYTAIGKSLVINGAILPDKVSMQSIKAWLRNNPDDAPQIMNQNRSYVFFKEIIASAPIGTQGVPLTPQRSLAIDPAFIDLGTPVWLDVAHSTPLRRLVIAQDTGGAIKGPIRGDFYWGIGQQAGESAGTMHAAGNYYVLLPKSKCSDKA